jgi:glycosyltransferase involved in cell wall biosynthesis
VVPARGPAADLYADIATVTKLDYGALTVPRDPSDWGLLVRRIRRDVATFHRQIRASRPDLVIAVTAMTPAVLLAARRAGVPSILHAAEVLDAGRSPLRRLAGRGLMRVAGSAAGSVAACSETVAVQYRSLGIPAEVVYPPIRNGAVEGDGSGFRRRHRIPAGAPLVLCAGSISKGRGQEVLIEAMGRVRERIPEARCALVGEPFPRAADIDYQRSLRELVATQEGIVLCGFERRIADAYAAADLIVNPARGPEAFGKVACEALAASRPVVSTRVGATPEVLRNEETALLVPPRDPSALGVAIEDLLSNPQRARRLAEAGRRDVHERFDPERSLGKFQRLVLTTMHGAAAGEARRVRPVRLTAPPSRVRVRS